MALPRTFLLTAPDASMESFGRMISCADLIKGLREINSAIYAWEQLSDGLWYPNKCMGATCLWLGDPGGKSRKITAITFGPIPEWTQMGDHPETGQTTIIKKGWRAIFHKVLASGAATKEQIEKKFRVQLDYDDSARALECRLCLKTGHRRPVDGGADDLCRMHSKMRRIVRETMQSGNV